jgi:hypothetical protein
MREIDIRKSGFERWVARAAEASRDPLRHRRGLLSIGCWLGYGRLAEIFRRARRLSRQPLLYSHSVETPCFSRGSTEGVMSEDMGGQRGFDRSSVRLAGGQRPVGAAPRRTIGAVSAIGGSVEFPVVFDMAALETIATSADPARSRGRTVGSRSSCGLGSSWLIANVRDQRLETAAKVIAQVDFLGEGEEEKLTGKLYSFRRGVTRYPIPGSPVFQSRPPTLNRSTPPTTARISRVGNVYPTKDIRAALYIDSMLGKHFALLGSTGTGKSTAAALILHRICELAPQGHVVMIDPHGEYSAAFKTNGALFDVSNLALAVLADELRGTLRGVHDHRRVGPSSRLPTSWRAAS